MTPSRRAFVATAGANLAAPAWGAPLLSPTPAEVIGPFYPIAKPRDRDADLTRIAGRDGRAIGKIIELTGRLLNRQGHPISAARVELWQANAAGRYRHPSDENPAPLDPAFEGYATVVTDREGEFRILTIKPGGHAGGRRGYRTPHLHFDISGRINRMMTQMYFPDEELTNAGDQLLSACIEPAAVLAKALPDREDGIARYAWMMVLRDA